jgi:Prealbumin-like fold domain
MTAVRKELRRRRKPLWFATVFVALAAVLVFAFGASTAPLPGSNFESEDGNLIVNGTPPALDWANVTELRQADLPSGANDNSFGQGTKEDTPVPTVVTGSIPPQKSDLTHFGVYLQTNAAGHRYLDLFWRRVQEPSGTTNMDFEFNKSSEISGNGVTPVRTAGDALIQYDLERGGSTPTLWISRWVTTGSPAQCEANNALPCWDHKVNLTAAGIANGSINTSPITAANSDGLGAMSARTFGEAEVDLDALTGTGGCVAFGSAYLKSRSSNSFTSELKDFIAPENVNIDQCASVIIHKQTDPNGSPQLFDYTKSFNTDPAIPDTFQLADDGEFRNDNVTFGNGYTVTEDALPAGWSFDHLDCSASSGVDPSISNRTVTFNIDNAGDVLDCTYFNESLGTIIVKKITDDGQGSFDYTSNTLPDDAFTLTTTEPGEAGADSETFANIPTGNYDVAETVPAGWNLVSATCDDDDGSDPASIVLDVNETVTCTFHNAQERATIIVEKITDDGVGSFDFTSGTLSPSPFTLTTTQPGVADSRTFSGLLVGIYDVDETVPAGWNLVSATCDDDSPISAIDLQDGETVTCTFHNARERGAIDITKMRKHAADGPGDHPHPGVTFTVEGGELPIGGVQVVTDENGRACVNNLVLSSFVGNYTVTETLPGGYHNVGPLSQGVSVNVEASGCGDEPSPDADVRFDNMPLTNIVITVDSQVDGGTASVIDCDGTISNTDPNGDGGQTHNNLEPGTYTCTVVVDP